MRGPQALCVIALLAHGAAEADDEPNYWQYAITSDGKQNATTLWWDGGEEAFEGKPARFVQEVTVVDKVRTHRRTYFDVTDDGVVQLGTRGDIEMEKAVTTSETVVSPPLVVIPTRFAAGTKRVVKATTQIKTSGSDSEMVIEGTVEIAGVQKAVVPAGAFDCTVVRTMTTSTFSIADQRMTIKTNTDACYDVAVGLVQLTTTSDSEVRPKQGKPTITHQASSMALAKYRVIKPPWQMVAVTTPRTPPATPATATPPVVAPAP